MIAIVVCAGFFLILLGVYGIYGAAPFMFIIKSPLLSPFFPDFAPFEASVTLNTNFAPIIEDLDSEIFVCENKALSRYFNVSDRDGGPLDIAIEPFSPFFIEPAYIPKNPVKTKFDVRLFSLLLDKSRVNRTLGYRIYERVISVSDGLLSDRKNVNITVIEINNAPVIAQIGAHTVWTYGDDTTFYYQVMANDVEDGNQNMENLIFNLTFLNGAQRLFNISANGSMIFIPNATLNFSEISLPITYNLSLCVRDKGILKQHPRILQECNQTGLAITTCENFSITVTDENRAPIITDYFPINLNFSAQGEVALKFNISGRDPDGTIPDTYWYVDGAFMKRSVGIPLDYFSYVFGCDVGGRHHVKAEVTDGLLNDSLQWNIDVTAVSCPSTGGGGGGGGGMIKKCKENWVCPNWNVCQDVEVSLTLGILKGDMFRQIKEDCRLDFFDKCGFQIKSCLDTNYCNTSATKPEEIGDCYYVQNPGCSDSVKNCHDGACETLVDCGGSCAPCPTCSDGIENQGELGIDCGGPCPSECPPKPVRKIGIQYILIGLLLLFIIIIIIEVVKIYGERKKMKEKEQIQQENI